MRIKNDSVYTALVAGGIFVFCAVVAIASQYAYVLWEDGQLVVSGGTSNINSVAAFNKYDDVAVAFKVQGSPTMTNGIWTAVFRTSVDGTDFTTGTTHSMIATGLGATASVTVSNFSLKAKAYLKLISMANACYANSDSYGTGIVTYATKPVRFGGN